MELTYNYIYNEKGVAEYVVIPVKIWDKVKEYLSPKNPEHKKFNPREYKGMLSHLNLDIEQELINMRKEWTRNF